MKNLNFLFLITLICFCPIYLSALNPKFDKKAKPAFDSIETIFQKLQDYQQIVITTNFDSLTMNRRSDKGHLAILKATGDGQADLELKLKIRPRGKFRRMKCDFPPVQLDFTKSDLAERGLYQKYDKIKLVTQCKDETGDKQAVLKEYWTYKMYNEVTDSSFRVHQIDLTYQDEIDPKRTIESYAFIIENNKELAHRLNGELVEGVGIKPEAISPLTYHNVLLFNYMVGNTDWQVKLQKNLKLIKHGDSDLYTIVPYDFDFAKIVEPSYVRYATHISNLDANNRAAMDSFKDKESLAACIATFKALQKTGFTCYKNCDKLGSKEKSMMTAYIKSFFKLAKNKQKMEQTFLSDAKP